MSVITRIFGRYSVCRQSALAGTVARYRFDKNVYRILYYYYGYTTVSEKLPVLCEVLICIVLLRPDNIIVTTVVWKLYVWASVRACQHIDCLRSFLRPL